MGKRFITSLTVLIASFAVACVAFAQTYGTKGYAPGAWHPGELPPDVSKPSSERYDPRDLSGVWSVPTAGYEMHTFTSKPDPTVPDLGKQSPIVPPMTDYGKAKLEANKPGYGHRAVPNGTGNNPLSICDPLGYPYALWAANLRPIEFIQVPGRVLMHLQYHDVLRTIWTDGRQLPKNPDPAWYGYSVGHWEEDTFVIDSTGYDDRTWLDHFGDPHSDQMRLQERWHRAGPDTLELTMTLTDPKIYKEPWVSDKMIFVRRKVALFEEICAPSEETRFNEGFSYPDPGKPKQ
jgi:hypothetical protein